VSDVVVKQFTFTISSPDYLLVWSYTKWNRYSYIAAFSQWVLCTVCTVSGADTTTVMFCIMEHWH